MKKEEIHNILKNIIINDIIDISQIDLSPCRAPALKKCNREAYKKFNSLYPGIFNSVSEFIYFLNNYKNIDQFINEMFCECGNRNKFNSHYCRYNFHCSPRCSSLDKAVQEKVVNTTLKTYGVNNVMKCDEIKEKLEKTNLKKYGVKCVFQNEEVKEKIKNTMTDPDIQKNKIEKTKKTVLNKYGTEFIFQNEEVKEKIKTTIIQKYGVDNISKLDSVKKQKNLTKKKHNSFNKSKDEEYIFQELIKKFKVVHRQYSDKRYPFSCDFYIEDIDLFIEYQGFPTHGIEPFNPLLEEHQILLKDLKIKSNSSNYYRNMIVVWTLRDPEKRETAIKNKLNWKEFFNLSEFQTWLQKI